MELTLVIGNRNYSSWSLRPWLLLRHLGLAFGEVQLLLDTPEFARQVAAWSPAGRVPVLRHGAVTVWDSLAICEYACELAGRGWPRDRAARAHARAVSAEMHAGFQALRSAWPMNIRAVGRRTVSSPALESDLRRVVEIWSDCRARHRADGPWLFGEYSVADAMYAPVALRFRTYGATLSGEAAGWHAHALADPHLRDWMTAAEAEPWVVAADEAGHGR